jgi:hypothetical protein
MAQHYPLTRENEPKIFRSVDRIAAYHVSSSKFIASLRKDFEEKIIYRKKVIKLSNDYKMFEEDYVVLKIGKYDLQNSNWWTSAVDGKKDMFSKQYDYSNLDLECHIDQQGKIISIFMVQ